MEILEEIQNQINELSNIDDRILIESQISNTNEVLIAVTINKSLIHFEKEPLDIIRFLLQIKKSYPETPPSLFCISRFCLPELCDGRDFLEDTLQMKWDKKNCFLKLIISQIPSFVQRYVNYINGINNMNNIILKRKMFGNFYLDGIYETSILKYIPYLYFDSISEIVSIEGKKMNCEDRKILITDNFLLLFCNKSLYEIDKLKLIFVGPITSLLYIRQFYKDGIVLLKWIIKGKGLQSSNFTMQFKTEDGDYIVDTLIDNLSKKSINFKVTNKVNGNIKREGTVPMVEINLVEEEVKNLENKIQNKESMTKESISILINLYEKAIQYYSALNDKRFEIYIKKIHDVYSNNEFTSLLNMKTVTNSNNQYNVTQFKRKRKKKGFGDDGTNKKKKDKKPKKNIEQNNDNIINEIGNNKEEETNKNDKKNNKDNNLDNNLDNSIQENIQNYKIEEKKEEKKEENIEINNQIVNNKVEEIRKEEEKNIIKEKEEKKEEEKKEEKKENKKETKKRPKRNLKKKEENEKMNSIKNEISQRMILDKKEIEEMLKNELNFGSPINNENKQEEKKQEINDKGNI